MLPLKYSKEELKETYIFLYGTLITVALLDLFREDPKRPMEEYIKKITRKSA